jgi:aldose 1-epimerase
VPTANKQLTDVVLGFDDINRYIDSFSLPSPPYLGAVVGRYAGRINNAAFTLNGAEYKLNANHGPNTLHGGKTNFSRVYWYMKRLRGGDNPSITLTYTSPDGDEQFPGELTVEVTYSLTEKNELNVSYHATTTADTVINLTQHAYFNLDGHTQSVNEQQLFVNSKQTLEVRPDGIPTGKFLPVANTAFDFTTPHNCPAVIDNSFILQNNGQPAATLHSAKTGLTLTVYTNQPSVHIYVGGNCFGTIHGKEGAAYGTTSGICFETQNYPDAPNQSHFPTPVLKKGEVYNHSTIFIFSTL